MYKAIELVYLTRVEGANLNSAGTEGVISILKKTEDINGQEYIRISGQSVKYQIRQIWKEQEGLSVSPVSSRTATGEKVIVSAGDPMKHIDDDLFGYMIATRGKLQKKRTGVVRTNGMISLFPYRGDRDFGVRYDPDDPAGEHNIYEVEITTNIMRGNFFVETDRLGKFDKNELGKEKVADIAGNKKEKRLSALFDALFNLFGGAHLSNYFTKTYPELVVVALLDRKLPVIGDKLTVNGKSEDGYSLNIDRLKESIETFNDRISEILIGGFVSTIQNWEEVKKLAQDNKKVKVMTLKELIEEISKRKFYK